MAKKEETAANVETTTTATTTTENANVETFEGIITNILFNDDTDRLSIVTNVEFPTKNLKTGEETDSNTFGLHVLNFVNQAKQYCEMLEIADSFNVSVNNIINPQIIKLLFVGANVEFTREYVEKGSEREYKGVYENDTYVTKITKVSTNVSQLKQQMAFNLLQSKPTIPSRKSRAAQTAVQSLNPFNI